MKVDKHHKADLSEKVNQETIDKMLIASKKRGKRKVLLRIDDRTQIQVYPEQATPEHAEVLRRRYNRDSKKQSKD